MPLAYSTDDEGEDAVNLHYVPSPSAKSVISQSESPKGWPPKVEKQLSRMREVSGALFRFPIWGQDDTIDAFITDWSPFPPLVRSQSILITRSQMSATMYLMPGLGNSSGMCSLVIYCLCGQLDG